MGKYDPLNEQLRESKRNEVRFSFREIEKLLGADLPKEPARRRPGGPTRIPAMPRPGWRPATPPTWTWTARR
jgi:hypothetical protein